MKPAYGDQSDDITQWSMRKRLDFAVNDHSDPIILGRLTEWVLADLDRSLEGFDTFAAWKPNPPEERDVDILSALTKNPSLPVSAVMAIVESGWWRIKPRILFRLPAPANLEGALRQLVDDESSAIWQGASYSVAVETWYFAYTQGSEDKDLPRSWDWVLDIAWRVPRLLALVAQRPDLKNEEYAKLAFHPNPIVRQNVARNSEAPEHARVAAALRVTN